MIQEQRYVHLHPGALAAAFAAAAVLIAAFGAIPMGMIPMMSGHMAYPMHPSEMGMGGYGFIVASLGGLLLSAMIGGVIAWIYNVVVDAVTTPRDASSGTNVLKPR